jgi:hypothetical protein
LALTAAVSAIAAAGFSLGGVKPALAEFEIQESNIEAGEVELEYRGAVHWGFPKQEKQEAGGDAEGLEDDASELPLRQSHDFELQMGVTDWWLLTVTANTDQPLDGNYDLNSMEVGTQFELKERKGDGIGLAVQLEYQQALNHGDIENGDPNEFGFGPIIELAKGPVLMTLNPLFGKQLGEFADQESLGFEYGWQAKYSVNKRWGLGVEAFGEIEDLANAGSFQEQNHSIGPTVFLNFGDTDDEDKAGENEADDNKAAGPAGKEFSMNIGVQFGLTDVTSDAAVKFQGSLAF